MPCVMAGATSARTVTRIEGGEMGIKTDPAERQAEFHALAERRYAEFLETGLSIPWEEMRRYLMDRLAGKSAKRPVPRKLADT